MYLKNDENGSIGEFNLPQTGWSTPTQEEIDAYLLVRAKIDKNVTLNTDREVFSDTGFLYSSNTFDVSSETMVNLGVKDKSSGSNPSKFKFGDIDNVMIDFGNQSAFITFTEALTDERDRIMVYYVETKKVINDCTTVAQVDAITIDFSA